MDTKIICIINKTTILISSRIANLNSIIKITNTIKILKTITINNINPTNNNIIIITM